MTNKEAIEYFQRELNDICRKCKFVDSMDAHTICDYCKEKKPYRIAAEAIKKQIPKKMYRDKVYKCSSCNNKIIKANDGCIDYCCCCGQRIDWSEDE